MFANKRLNHHNQSKFGSVAMENLPQYGSEEKQVWQSHKLLGHSLLEFRRMAVSARLWRLKMSAKIR